MTHHGRILTIQSHVTFGYVGNKAAVFPLQCLGYDVDVVNTVNFSNHSGYGRFGGSKATSEDLQTIFRHLEENEMLAPVKLLTGYIPGAEALASVAKLAKKLKSADAKLIYLMDPVIGDAGKMYVSPDVVPVYKTMLESADIITPNWFEAEVLSGITVTSMDSLRQSLKILHDDLKTPNVVVSSMLLPSWLADVIPVTITHEIQNDYILCLTSCAQDKKVYVGLVPLIPGYFSGVGDLFSALLIGHYASPPSSISDLPALPYATSLALHKTHECLVLTHEYNLTLPEEERQATDDEADKLDPLRKTRRMRGRELRLIQGQDAIREEAPADIKWMQEWPNFWS